MILYNPTVSGSLLVTGSLTTTGTLTSQTLVVQTITSSVDFVTGSSVNGSLSSNTHQFTGSVLMSGSLSVGGISTFSKAVTIGEDTLTALTIGRYSAGIPIAYIKASTSSTGGFRLTNHNGSDVIVVDGSNNITLDGPVTNITGNIIRGNAREFATTLFPLNPYTSDLQLNVTHTGWGSNYDSGTLYVEFSGRTYGNNQITAAYGTILYRMDTNGLSINSVSTAGVTLSNVTISTDVATNLQLKLTFQIAAVADRLSIFARTLNTFVNNISATLV